MSSLNKAFLKAYHKSDAVAVRLKGAAAPVAAAPVASVPVAIGPAHAAPAPIATACVSAVAAQSPPAPHFVQQPSAGASLAATVEVASVHAATNRAAKSNTIITSVVESTESGSPASMASLSSTAEQTGSAPDAPIAEAPAGAATPAPATVTATGPAKPPTPFAIIDSAHAPVKAPHARFSPPSTIAPAAEAQAIETPILARPQPSILHSSPATPSVWQPVFELSNFSWPEITEAILAAAPGQLQTAAMDLAEACRRHRKLVAVTGVRGGEGASVIAMTLARALAAQQQKVILVDAHFAAPRLADCLGVAAEVGWEESLAGERPLAEAVVHSLADHVSLLPLKQPTESDWRLAETRLKSCFDELRRHFDVVLIDAGPLGEPTDRRQLLAWAAPCRVDRALVVLDGRAEIEQAMAEVDERLQGCGIAQWSFVDNFAAA